MNFLPCLYLNRWDGQLAPDRSINQQIGRHQWTVVTAPRPLPGDVHWVGGIADFPTGSYAAGPWSQYADQWRALDARQVVLTNNRLCPGLTHPSSTVGNCWTCSTRITPTRSTLPHIANTSGGG